MENITREKIMSYKEDQLKKFRIALLMTGIVGALLLAFCAYVLLVADQLASIDKFKRDNIYGLDVITFAAAIGCVYSFINYGNLKKNDKELNRNYFVEFKAKTERYVAASQGIMFCNLFGAVYWFIYSSALHIRFYVDHDGGMHDFLMQNRIMLALAVIAAIFSFIAVRYGFNMKHKLGLSKEEYAEMTRRAGGRRRRAR